MCIKHTAQPEITAASSAPGSRRARTSLIIAAPAAAAACMTSGLLVSTERMACVRELKREITGTTRRSSSSKLTGCAPGRVDPPPPTLMSPPSPPLPPHIDDGRPLLRHLHSALNGIIQPYELPPIRERVRRDIQHAHDDGPLEPEHPSAQPKHRM